jgi:hypothetical protein
MSNTHKCPANGCNAQVPYRMLMCGSHWKLVPRAIQDAVYREYRRETHSAAHIQACKTATEAVNRELRIANRFGIRTP